MISYLSKFLDETSSLARIAVIVAFILGLHVTVIAVRHLGNKFKLLASRARLSKLRTIASLATSTIVFLLYFIALGLILREIGVSLTAYLASASIMGLAIGFGSQGLVQDVVNGLTVVFSGLFNVGDMIEIAGQSGIVRNFGVRFTVIENSLGARVYIPNRTIANVVVYPRGYVQAIVDIMLTDNLQATNKVKETITPIVSSLFEQLPGTLLAAPAIKGRVKTNAGKEYLRIEFHIWPGRGSHLETAFKQELLFALRELDPKYEDWMVSINYEAEKKSASLQDE
jgi:small-conductance mechanosensitive channel